MSIDRREFLKLGGYAALAGGLPAWARPATAQPAMSPATASGKADYTLRIARSLVELAPDYILSTKTYNGQFPGPLLRFKEGQRVVVDVHNDTEIPEQLHWHGQLVPADVDGAAEEGTPYIPPHGMRRLSFVPGPSGFRFYHTHTVAGSDLTMGQYGGLVGPVYIEPRHEPGLYDREVFLTLKEFDPVFSRGGDESMDFLRPREHESAL
jgi:FtsP/CotA-like multicopper oxidase with cupredoxin domain